MSLFGAVADHYVDEPAGSTWVSTITADSPIFWQRLGEASGTTAADISGNGNTGTYVGSPTLGTTGLITGDTDTAVTLNGTSQRVISDSATIAGYPTAAITCEIAFKLSALSSQTAIFTKSAVDSSFGSGWSFFIIVTAAGQLQGWVFSGATQRAANSANGAIVTGTKYVAAVRADTSSVDLLINGTQVATTTGLPGAINAGTAHVVVGDWDAAVSHQWFPGVVDEALIFPTKLSDARLAAHAALV